MFICRNVLSLCLGVVAEQKDYVAEGMGQDSAEKLGLNVVVSSVESRQWSSELLQDIDHLDSN